MPLEAVAINSFNTPIMREPKHDNDLRDRVTKLFDDEPNITEDADNLITLLEGAFRRGALLYVGMFNDKPIIVVGCFDDGQTDTKRLQYLAVHPENKNRGIEGRFIKQVYDAEVRKGVTQFMPVDDEMHQIMTEYELLRVKR